MRFTAHQLRLLQEDLAPALPPLAPPPTMTHLPAPLSAAADPAAQALRVPCSLLPPAYLCAAALLVGAAAAGLPLTLAPAPFVLSWQALAASHSRPAQALGLLSALCLPAVLASPRTTPGGALLVSCFLSLAAPGGGALRLVTAALTPLVAAAVGLAALADSGQLRADALRMGFAVLCAQAVLSTARLHASELTCAARPAVV
jgi:hypothetical protein